MLEEAYNSEEDAGTRLRILLALRVKFDSVKPAEASRGMHRSRSWATKWLKRFDGHGLEGLRTMERSGRPPKMDRSAMLSMKRKVTMERSGWTIKEVREFIHKEADVTYSERQVYRLMHQWGMRAIVPEKRLVSKASREERLAFKKGQQDS